MNPGHRFKKSSSSLKTPDYNSNPSTTWSPQHQTTNYSSIPPPPPPLPPPPRTQSAPAIVGLPDFSVPPPPIATSPASMQPIPSSSSLSLGQVRFMPPSSFSTPPPPLPPSTTPYRAPGSYVAPFTGYYPPSTPYNCYPTDNNYSNYRQTGPMYPNFLTQEQLQRPPPSIRPPPPFSSSSVPRSGGPRYNSYNRSDGPKYDRNVETSKSHSSATSTSAKKLDDSKKIATTTDRKNVPPLTERDKLLVKWRSNFCETPDDITRKLAELEGKEEKECWIRSSPADVYYTRQGEIMESTNRLDSLCSLFEKELIERAELGRQNQVPYNPPPRKRTHKLCRHRSEKCSSSESSDEEFNLDEDCSMEELSRKIQHLHRLHPDLWHNEPGEMNDGPLCRCSAKSRRSGIRHGIYPGEKAIPKCKPNSNNAERLYHYRITISPPTNFLTKTPTIIKYDEHEFIFEGFSLLSHVPIGKLPTCKVIRFNIEYTILYIEEKLPENYTIQELDIFYKYLFIELLEMLDFSVFPSNLDDGIESCPCFHFLPRFVRDLPDNGKEVLAMSEVLRYLLDSSGPVVSRPMLTTIQDLSQNEWQDYVDNIKEMLVTNPGKKPCSIRVDQLDKNVADLPGCKDPDNPMIIHPEIVHFGIRPPQLSYAGNPEYQRAWREYVKFRHLLANMSKPSYDDKRKLEYKENKLQEMRTQGRMKRNVTVAISSNGFYRTGIMCDIVQHAMLIPVLTSHLRFHWTLDELETNIKYKFKNRYLLQLALTHPSYKENFGTNPDHARNSLTNCGIRQPEYGDRKIHYMNNRKRGINTLINIMSRFGKECETDSNISHNERLEFLGDAVVEFLTSIHLYHMFPELEEGGLATYRAAIVQNQHLAVLAKKLRLDEFMLYAHGSDLCHELELRHAMANCFEALMGALLLDGGIDEADKVFGGALFQEDEQMRCVWENYPPHPLQEQEPLGDRQWIDAYQILQELTKFEDSIGYRFRHIRLLARAFTDRSIGFTHLTLGSNQRMEFLGDTVLQLICSEYLYRHFPEHHEGHLSLLRSSLVNNRTQAVVCNDLGMTQYAVFSNPKPDMKTKDRADLLEAFLGALYIDGGLEPCQIFCQVCLFPRLQMFIMNQDWNDPKSKLQQCCLTLRTMDNGEPDIPIYKVIECIGPTNTRVYTVAVYFRGKRLACATGHSIQQAEMNTAKTALENSRDLFPQLDHQKRVIAQSIKRQKGSKESTTSGGEECQQINKSTSGGNKRRKNQMSERAFDDESNLPKQYRSREDISSDELEYSSDSLQVVANTSDTKRTKRHKKKKKKPKKQKDVSPKNSIETELFSPLSDNSLDLPSDDYDEIQSNHGVIKKEKEPTETEQNDNNDDNKSQDIIAERSIKTELIDELSDCSIESGEIL